MGVAKGFKPTLKISETEMRQRIKQLDLSDVILKVSLPLEKRGLGWDEQKTKRISEEYLGFLFVNWKYPGEHIPSIEVDQFWHTHIIFTEKYHADCEFLFGTYLHHTPNFKRDLVEPDWWKTAFDTKYIPKYRTFNENTAPIVTTFLTKILPRGSVLDLGCGTGRISHGLHAEGYEVIGIDYSKEMIEEAKKGPGTYLQADMRKFSLTKKVDSVISIFSSFGYFNDQADDIKVLKQVHSALTPKGVFVLDLRPRLSDEEWRIIKHDDFIGRYRQYSQDEISTHLVESGFFVKDVYGNYDQSTFTKFSPRMILVSIKI